VIKKERNDIRERVKKRVINNLV